MPALGTHCGSLASFSAHRARGRSQKAARYVIVLAFFSLLSLSYLSLSLSRSLSLCLSLFSLSRARTLHLHAAVLFALSTRFAFTAREKPHDRSLYTLLTRIINDCGHTHVGVFVPQVMQDFANVVINSKRRTMEEGAKLGSYRGVPRSSSSSNGGGGSTSSVELCTLQSRSEKELGLLIDRLAPEPLRACMRARTCVLVRVCARIGFKDRT